MEKKLRILFVTSEIEPFLKITSAADVIRQLPQKLQERGHDIRIFMPKFGVINERRNRLHEVVRLSGINIKVAGEEKPLTIKVASVPNARSLQVYFLDNEDYFKRKSALTNPTDNSFHLDNDERAIFFCKGVIETVRKLGWSPDIIHCHDWMTSFLPMYMRTHYQNDPMFRNTKIVFSVYENDFDGQGIGNFIDKMRIDGINDNALDTFEENNYMGLCKGGIAMSDAVVKGAATLNETLETHIQANKPDSQYIETDEAGAYAEKYHQLYATLTN